MNCIIRGVRVIDPLARLDAVGQDVWLSDGRIIAIYKHIGEGTLPVIDLTPPPGGVPAILCPAFIDLHAHVREPDLDDAGNPREDCPEDIMSAAAAAAAGGFAHLLTMANTRPPIDTPDRVTEQSFRAVPAPIQILTAAALTRDLAGGELVDIAGCAEAGAAAFTDDGHNSASPRLLAEALRAAAAVGRPVMIHPEDEETVATAGGLHGDTTRSSIRPALAETRAVDFGVRAVAHAGTGRLHLQHVSAAGSIDIIRRAKDEGLAVTAEVTPHHLGMWLPLAEAPTPTSLAKVNPPLREERDRLALIQALRDGIIDAVATDHAPHRATDKTDDYEASAPGFIGLETALATCITFGGMGGDWLPVLIERLTAGPYRALGEAAGLREPRLRIGEAATCVLFDPAREWTVGDTPLKSNARNTPLWGTTLRGRVLMTLVDGAVVHHDEENLELPVGGGVAGV